MIPRFRPHIDWKDVAQVIWASEGDPQAFEAFFAEQYGVRHALWFPLGRVAVRAYLENLETPGPKAALSPFNCVALGNAVKAAGYLPLWVDTATGGFAEDPEALLEALGRADVGCGIPVAQWGIPSEVPLDSAAKPLLYDYALASLHPTPPPLRDQDGVVYSFNWGKPLAFLSGAFLCGNDPQVAALWRAWRGKHCQGTSRAWLQAAGLKLAFSPQGFGLARTLHRWGLGARLAGQDQKRGPTPEAKFSMASRRVLEISERRIRERDRVRQERGQLVSRYGQGLGEIPAIALPSLVDTLSHFPIRLSERDSLHGALLRRGIFSSPDLFSSLLNEYPWLRGEVFTPLIEARRLKRTTLHLPLYAGLGEGDQQRILDGVREWAEAQDQLHRAA